MTDSTLIALHATELQAELESAYRHTLQQLLPRLGQREGEYAVVITLARAAREWANSLPTDEGET